MDAGTIRRINLLECLLDEHPDVDPPSEDVALEWTEQQLRTHFAHAASTATSDEQHAPHDEAHHSHDARAAGAAASEAPSRAGAGNGEDGSSNRLCQPGGGRSQDPRPDLDPANAPPTLRTHQLAATVDGYRKAAIADGIPFRCAAHMMHLNPRSQRWVHQ